MPQNICEYLREEAVGGLFKLNTVNKAWPIWQEVIKDKISHWNAVNVIDLGDYLSEIFRSTGSSDRSQSSVSGGGTGWEALVCWYLNLCLLESRTVVVKFKNSLIPQPIRDAITVKYGTFPSNTESDLIAITFPDKADYISTDKFNIIARDNQGSLIDTKIGRNNKFNYLPIINSLTDRDFNDFEIGIIQCKTNWNDNAQIPMLWDMIYSSKGFEGHRTTVGSSIYSIKDIRRFTYSFVTVPTSSEGGSKITPNSTCVKRVQNLSGGNYWGKPTANSVAYSLKEIFGRNFSSASSHGLRISLNSALPQLKNTYSYFNI
ncbi:hypothetical protein P4679_31665 [Priestia megaterium]|uniref:hypothetical protein n=1 Tax=Priestia megaterium TaxID=1404 RepID=UPI002E229B08|nr:hypothetical protein [Priestia megaterium]